MDRPRAYTPKHLAEKILKSHAALEGERRQVTVLFADLAGFTALAEHRDPEDVHQLINRCFELITAEVHRFEGTVNQYTGDGVMALFGAPIAHEDAPRRAVHAALAIQRALADYGTEVETRLGHPLQMRIGVNTGPVVVGRIGDDLRMDYTAVGETTNLAARLQQIARPGSVVVSATTHRLISGYFETLDLGEVSVKGHAPVCTFEVLRSRGRRARLDVAVERGLTPLVGRGREVDALVELFARAKAGHGQVVYVAGEAGIGKSRLLLEFRRRLAEADEDATWLEGRAISFGQSIPLMPVFDQLRESFRIEEFDGEPEIIAKVEHGMRRMGGLEAHIPFVRYLLSVDPGEPAVTAMDASGRRKRIFDAVLALSLRGATLRPIVFVFEDLHWIDTSTEEYLGALMDSVARVPIMLVLTFRLGYTPPFGTRRFQTLLTLDTLSESEAIAMAGRVLGVEDFPPELRRALLEKAEGVPLFVEEVTKTLLDLGVLRRDNGGYRMVKEIAEVGVPDTIQGIIMSRLDRLGEDGKRTVQLASVIGRRQLNDYAFAAGDTVLMARAHNPLGGVHLELFDADEAIRLCQEGDEIAQKVFPWPEPRGHALLKIGLAHLQRGEHGLAEEFFQRAWALLDLDVWMRWRWHIPLLRARGELALAEGRLQEAGDWAAQSLELATRTGSRKHVARAQSLQGDVLAASGRFDAAVRTLESSIGLAERLGTPREVWMGKAALGTVLARLGHDHDAEAHLAGAAQTIEAIAAKLTTPRLRQSFLSAGPVTAVFRTLGGRPPVP